MESEKVTYFIVRWRALTFMCPQKFTLQVFVSMRLTNFRYNLSTAFLAQSFDGFNALCMKPITWRFTSTSAKRALRRVVETGIQSQLAWHQKKESPIPSSRPLPIRLYRLNLEHHRVPLQQSSRSCTKLYQEKSVKISIPCYRRQQHEYCFSRGEVWGLFGKLVETKLLTLQELRRPEEVGISSQEKKNNTI